MSFRSPIRSRTLGAVLSVAFLATCLLGNASSAHAAGPAFTFSGGGYGHGIGLSQYGAYGYALNGWKYDAILKHYYSGTSVDRIADIATEVKVNLDPDYTGDSYRGASSWTVRAVNSRLKVYKPTASTQYEYVNIGTKAVFTYNETAGRIEMRVPSDPTRLEVFYGDIWVVPETAGKTLQVFDASGGHNTTGVQYRGRFRLERHAGGTLDLINYVPMQYYLYGVVPREMPSGWSTEALRAQAVAARSYSYAEVVAGKVLKCTTWSQVYCGYGYTNSKGVWVGETASTNAAVDATDDVVVRHNGSVIVTYFFSQSGGHTANVEDVWVPSNGDLAAKAAAYPYLRGVPDPYESQAGQMAPTGYYSPWSGSNEKTFDGTSLADKLRAAGWGGVPASPAYVKGIIVESATSGHARYVTFTFSNGATVKTTGDKVRWVLGLKSTFFNVGPPYARIAGASRYETSVELSKKAFASTAPVAVLASGENYPDALCGTGLAGAKGGSLLLTGSTYLPATIGTELGRLKPSTVYLMGGTGALGKAVEDAVRARLPSASIVRVDGADRYETSQKAAELIGAASTAVIVNGGSWPDAVSAAGVAYAAGAPMLLTPKDKLDDGAASYLSARKPARVLMIGGSAVLSSAVQSQVQAAASVVPTRLEGHDRAYTSAKVAEYARSNFAFTDEQPLFASGESYADALSAGTLSGVSKRVMLLTGYDTCWAGTAWGISGLDYPDTLWIVGGTAAVSSGGVSSLQAAYAAP